MNSQAQFPLFQFINHSPLFLLDFLRYLGFSLLSVKLTSGVDFTSTQPLNLVLRFGLHP